jgi:hypothetical protein
MKQIDTLATTSIQSFLNSGLFRCCLLNRKALAAVILICWTSYCFGVYCLFLNQRPDVPDSIIFIFLLSFPMGTCLYFTCGFHVVDNVHLLYTVENKLNDVQIANPFDQRRWVESESDGEGEADTEEQQIIVLDVDQNDEAQPLLNNNTTRVDLNNNTRRDDLEPHTPKQYSLND